MYNNKSDAVIICNGYLDQVNGKTAHGLIRGSERFEAVGVIDPQHAGKDAGEVAFGQIANIPIYTSLKSVLNQSKPDYLIVGVAFPGGALPGDIKEELLYALREDITVVNGTHYFLTDREEFSAYREKIIDIRKPKAFEDLHFWTGEIYKVKTPLVGLLGIDCAVGKRTTGRILMSKCSERNKRVEMIYTGQTGWLQGYRYGFIFDSTPNDFVSGELEHAIVKCDREASPDLILVEGQSSLLNPAGPCGAEFLLSGNIKKVIYQHAPFRKYHDGLEEVGVRLPRIEDEFKLIEMYGAEVIAIALNSSGSNPEQLQRVKRELEGRFKVPVFDPFSDVIDLAFLISP